ncbi:MAG TPA: NAD-dependent malic enzyme [Dehalococcoidia bacterium]|jgi:malate dehydrogenase (oxaloacetate-decarboxylating)|nr:NAD-dependent malic enzyme [Dehalococcoidia bacterium]HIK88935.1 NAD-dependent malic enzyme [Dehalococcoidia bacterium]
MLGKITSAIGAAGGSAQGVDVVQTSKGEMVRDFTVNTAGHEHAIEVVDAIKAVENVKVRSVSDQTFLLHVGGKIEMRSRVAVTTRDDMSKAYTPGVGRVCMAIHDDPEAVWALTGKGHTVAVVSDGSAVLGLGDIGPAASLPVMEGKALLFKEFGGVDAWPIVLDTNDTEEIIAIVKALAPGFGGINLEDISAPRCFEIEDRLRAELDIPVFHDDQHGTAVVVLAGLINALKIVDKRPENLKIVVAGVGAAGTACTKILQSYGVQNIIGFDRQGALDRGRDYGDNTMKQWFADNTNNDNFTGTLAEGLVGADMMLGLAGPGLITREQLEKMSSDAIVFALSNPDPEIWPEEVSENVRVMATGRTDYPNQVNNSLCFPGLFRGVLDVRASRINDEMKVAAAVAIAGVIPDSHISEDFIIPSVFDKNVAKRVARGVARVAQETGVARRRQRRGDEIYAAFKS